MKLEEIQDRAVAALAGAVSGPEAMVFSREAVDHCLDVLDGLRQQTADGVPPDAHEWRMAMGSIATRVGSITVFVALFCHHAGIEMDACIETFLDSAEGKPPVMPS